jgi:hypothetical protein
MLCAALLPGIFTNDSLRVLNDAWFVTSFPVTGSFSPVGLSIT